MPRIVPYDDFDADAEDLEAIEELIKNLEVSVVVSRDTGDNAEPLGKKRALRSELNRWPVPANPLTGRATRSRS